MSSRRPPVWLLAIGLFAMAMQALGGSGVMPRSSGGSFHVEICTSKGADKLASTLPSGKTSLPDSGHQDCCKLCVSSAPLLLPDVALGVPLAPTFRSIFFAGSFSHSPAFERLSPPLRGPPPA